jgi:hypothetical protein
VVLAATSQEPRSGKDGKRSAELGSGLQGVKGGGEALDTSIYRGWGIQ